MKRPPGVWLAALLGILPAAYPALWLAAALAEPVPMGASAPSVLIFCAALLALFITAIGVWAGKAWAWWLAVVLHLAAAVLLIIMLPDNGLWEASALLAALASLLCLATPQVRAFCRTDGEALKRPLAIGFAACFTLLSGAFILFMLYVVALWYGGGAPLSFYAAMFAVAGVCLCAPLGLWLGKAWAWWLALFWHGGVAVFMADGVSRLIEAPLMLTLGALATIALLLTPSARRFCRAATRKG